jgi:hypothetical protein
MRQGTRITDELVDEICERVGSITDAAEAAALSHRFSKEQPAIASFILALTEELSANAREIAFYVGLVLWQCFEQSSTSPLREVSVKEVEALYDKLDSELTALHGVDERIIERRILYSDDYPEPAILRYIVEAIYEPTAEHDTPLTADEQGNLFIVLRVVADSLEVTLNSAQ